MSGASSTVSRSLDEFLLTDLNSVVVKHRDQVAAREPRRAVLVGITSEQSRRSAAPDEWFATDRIAGADRR
jgi:hypothetical protein